MSNLQLDFNPLALTLTAPSSFPITPVTQREFFPAISRHLGLNTPKYRCF